MAMAFYAVAFAVIAAPSPENSPPALWLCNIAVAALSTSAGLAAIFPSLRNMAAILFVFVVLLACGIYATLIVVNRRVTDFYNGPRFAPKPPPNIVRPIP